MGRSDFVPFSNRQPRSRSFKNASYVDLFFSIELGDGTMSLLTSLLFGDGTMSLNAATALSSFSSAVVLASEKSIAAVGDDNVDDFFNPPYPLFKLCSIARGRCVDADGLWCTVLWCVGLRGEDTGMRKDLDSPKDSPIELLLPLPYSRGASATTAAVTTRRSASESMLGDGPGRGTRARSHAGLDSHSSVVRAGDAGGSIATCIIMIDFNLTGKILGAPYYNTVAHSQSSLYL